MPFTTTFKYTGEENTATITSIHLPAFDGPVENLIRKSNAVQFMCPQDEDSDRLNEMLACEDSAVRLLAYDIIKNKYNLSE